MRARDIMAQNLGSLTSNFKGKMTKQMSTSTDFSKTMSDVQENQTKSNDLAVKQKSTVKDNSNKTDKMALSKDKQKLEKKEPLEVKKEVKEAIKTETSDENLERVILESGAVLTPQLLQQGMEQLEEKLTELVTEVMDITEEELVELLEQSGMKLVDLLNLDNLKQFVLDANGCEDAISMITNEGVANQYHDLLEGMKELDLDENLGITKEEVVNLLETIGNLQEEEVVQTNVEEKIVNSEETVNSEKMSVSKEIASPKDTNTTESEVKIVVEKETEFKSASDTASKDNKDFQEQANQDAKPMDLFVQNLVSAKGNDGIQQVGVEQVQVMREIVNQVVEQIKIAIKPQATSMELQLNPENLGKVELTVVSKNGLLTASFTAENQIAKEALESQMQVLKDNLNNQGVKVEAIEVNVSQFGFKQNTESGTDAQSQSRQQKKSGNRRINLNYFDEETVDVAEEEVLAAKVLKDNGGTVDYTA